MSHDTFGTQRINANKGEAKLWKIEKARKEKLEEDRKADREAPVMFQTFLATSLFDQGRWYHHSHFKRTKLSCANYMEAMYQSVTFRDT